MGIEIERKYLVNTRLWRPQDAGSRICQGYLNSDKERTVRVRVRDERAFLTIKGRNRGLARAEFEYEIPAADAAALLELCERPVIEKMRYEEEFGGYRWEIDCFSGENQGLVVAEVELERPNERPPLPVWAAAEVSGDPRYYNANLIAHPYCQWPRAARPGDPEKRKD